MADGEARARRFPGARYHDGERAGVQVVDVEIDGTWLRLVDPDTGVKIRQVPVADVRALDWSRRERMRLRLTEDDPARLALQGPRAITAIQRACPKLKALRSSGREMRRVALWGGGALVSAAFILLVVLPWSAGWIAAGVPDSFRDRLGREVEDALAARLASETAREAAAEDGTDALYCAAPAGRAALDELAARIADAQGMTTVPSVRVLRGTVANALAMPGGRILILAPLIEGSQGPNVIAGVLAHEIGHVVERHPMRASVHAMGLGALVSLLIGDVTGGAVIVAAVQTTLSSAYSRDQERAADAFALAALNALDIDARPLAAFLRDLSDGEDAGAVRAFLGTHPASAERAAEIEARATGTAAALTPEAWWDLRAICG